MGQQVPNSGGDQLHFAIYITGRSASPSRVGLYTQPSKPCLHASLCNLCATLRHCRSRAGTCHTRCGGGAAAALGRSCRHVGHRQFAGVYHRGLLAGERSCRRAVLDPAEGPGLWRKAGERAAVHACSDGSDGTTAHVQKGLSSITQAFLSSLIPFRRTQSNAFTVDMAASLELYHDTAVEHREELLEAEVAWLTTANVHVVVSDTVALACAAAHAAQLPCAVVTNFSWDFIYSGKFSLIYRNLAIQRLIAPCNNACKFIYLQLLLVCNIIITTKPRLNQCIFLARFAEYLTSLGSELRPMVWQIAEDFARASQLLRLPGHAPMPAFRDVVDVPLLVRPAMCSRDQASCPG